MTSTIKTTPIPNAITPNPVNFDKYKEQILGLIPRTADAYFRIGKLIGMCKKQCELQQNKKVKSAALVRYKAFCEELPLGYGTCEKLRKIAESEFIQENIENMPDGYTSMSYIQSLDTEIQSQLIEQGLMRFTTQKELFQIVKIIKGEATDTTDATSNETSNETSVETSVETPVETSDKEITPDLSGGKLDDAREEIKFSRSITDKKKDIFAPTKPDYSKSGIIVNKDFINISIDMSLVEKDFLAPDAIRRIIYTLNKVKGSLNSESGIDVEYNFNDAELNSIIDIEGTEAMKLAV